MTTKRSQTPGAPIEEPLEGQTQVPSAPDVHQPFPAADPLSLQRTSNQGKQVSDGAGLQFEWAAASKAVPVRSGQIHPSNSVTSPRIDSPRNSASNLPMTVKDAARF